MKIFIPIGPKMAEYAQIYGHARHFWPNIIIFQWNQVYSASSIKLYILGQTFLAEFFQKNYQFFLEKFGQKVLGA